MRLEPCLKFLRPYMWKPVAARNQVYLRFYHLARQHELAKADALKYPRIQHDAPPMRVPAFREKYRDIQTGVKAEEEVVLHGRLQSVRRASSKLFFLEFVGEFQSVQGLCNFRNLEATGTPLESFKKLSKLLNRGDTISVTGRATRTNTGELTIEATRLPQLLSPSLVPLPFKLTDDDTRIRQRHIDLLVNQSTADVLRLRSYIIKHMRDFLDEKGFLEFQTPILAENAGGAIARPFATRATEFPTKELSLRIAPELWLKRLVVGGIDKVFEIGPSFRNEGIDQTHNPEFTTCEFYNAYANLEDLIRLTEEFIFKTAVHCQVLVAEKLSSLSAVDLSKFMPPFKRLEVIPSLEDVLGTKLPDLAADTALEELIALVKANDIDVPETAMQSLPKLLDRLVATFIEPHSMDEPLFVLHHPVCMSPLSKSFTCPRTGQVVSARTELFVGGRELANMYEEENDPVAQRQKFVEQAKYKDPTATDPDDVVVVDESYIRALESGLPPTGGWGCGLERLVMLFSGTRRISDCLSFGNLRNVLGLSVDNNTQAVNVKKAEDGE